MKFLNAVTAGLVPMVAAKSMRDSRAKRDGHLKAAGVGANSISISKAQLAALGLSGAGIQSNALTQVIIVWFNQGAGVPTTVVNQQQTVTQTVTVGGGNAAAPPPPPPTGAPAAAPPPANNAPPAPPAGAAPPPASGTVGAPGTQPTHIIKVGGPKGLIFEPAEIKANILDMVIFEFYSANHTATQSTFEQPCNPLAGGMDTGHQANINNAVVPAPQVAMQVMVDTPLWFYCKTGNHCGNGMVFSINPTAAKTHAQFQAEAIKQKGNGAGGAITGNGGQAPPAAAPPAGAPPAGGAANNGTLPPVAAPANSLAPLPANGNPLPTNTVANGAIGTAPALPGVVPGVGTVNPDGSCSCVVMCGSGQFPSIQLQGGGSFGGVAGAVPAAGVVRR